MFNVRLLKAQPSPAAKSCVNSPMTADCQVTSAILVSGLIGGEIYSWGTAS